MSNTIPMTVTRLNGQEYPVNLYHDRFHQKRVVSLNGVIDEKMAESIIAQLEYLDEMETADICLEINSRGGEVSAGMAIYDCIRYGLRSNVITLAKGRTASMGAFLLAAGTKGKRYALPHAEIMIHQPLGGASGQAADVQIEAENILRTKKMLNTILAEHTGNTLEKIEKDTDRNNYMTAEEALCYGMIDQIGFPPLSERKGEKEEQTGGETWSSSEEIRKKFLDTEAAEGIGGPVLYRENGKKYLYGGDGHSIILGTTGYGKTACMMQTMVRELSRAGESMILGDAKGELYIAHESFLRERGYQVIVFDFRHLYQSTRWNPLQLIARYLRSEEPEKVEEGERMLRELAKALFRRGEERDPFWINSSQNLFMGLVKLLVEQAEDMDEITLTSVFHMLVSGEAQAGIRSYLKAFLEEMVQEESDGTLLMDAYLETAKETKASIRSVFETNLAPFVYSRALKTFLCNDGALDISELRDDQRTAIFVILNDQSKAYEEISAVLLGQLIQHYISLADSTAEGRLKHRMNVLLEELGNIGHCLGDLDRWMSGARSRSVRFHLVLQSYYSQLDDIYGKSAAETIRSNVKVLVAFGVNDLKTLEYLSAVCGEKEEKKGGGFLIRPLITPAEIHAFPVGKALVMVEGLKFIQRMPFYEDDYDLSGWKPPAEREARYEADLHIFPLQERVDQVLQKKLDEISKDMKELERQLMEGIEARENAMDFEADEDLTVFPDREEEEREELFARCIDQIHPDQRRMIIRKKDQLMDLPFFVCLSSVPEKKHARVVDILEQFGFETARAEQYADTSGAKIPVDELPKALQLVEILRNTGAEVFLMEDMEG